MREEPLPHDPELLIQGYLEDDLSPAESRILLEKLETDPALRQVLLHELRMTQMLRDAVRKEELPAVPDPLASRLDLAAPASDSASAHPSPSGRAPPQTAGRASAGPGCTAAGETAAGLQSSCGAALGTVAGTRGPAVESRPVRLRGWLDWAAGVAAALLLTWGVVQFLKRPPDLTVASGLIENPSGEVVTKVLADGTNLRLGPGARAVVRGPDAARGLGQSLLLEKGELELRTPPAPKAGIACRVETPEGLWAETTGARLKLARKEGQGKEDIAMDKARLKGIAAAVLLVTVIEGAARTGNAAGEEGRVASGEVRAVSAPAAAKLDEVTAARVKKLKENVDRFRLMLYHQGAPNKPFALTLSTRPGIYQPFGEPSANHLFAEVDPQLANRLLDHLATEGLLKNATSCLGMEFEELEFPAGESCELLLEGGDFLGVSLGWDLKMLQRLDGIRAVLDGEPAKQMDLLLGRLSGLRKTWEAEAAAAGEKIAWGQATQGSKAGMGPLQLGLTAGARTFETGRALAFTVHIKNPGQEEQHVYAPSPPSWWKWTFINQALSEEPLVLLGGEATVRDLVDKSCRIPAGGQQGFPCVVAAADGSWHIYKGGPFSGFTPGRYLVTATYGTWVTGSVEIEIVASAARRRGPAQE